MGVDEIRILRPPAGHGKDKKFLEGPEGKILLEFIHQQKGWLQENGVKLIQTLAPVGITRVARLHEDRTIDVELARVIRPPRAYLRDYVKGTRYYWAMPFIEHDLDVTLEDVMRSDRCSKGHRSSKLERVKGLPYKNVLCGGHGFITIGKLREVDAIMFSKKGVVITEVKTNLSTASYYDRAVGQVTIYREAFIEDFPSIAKEVPVYALLVGGQCRDFKFIEPTLKRSQISLYDVLIGKFLTAEPF